MTFEQLISTLKSNTAINHHIENLILIAKFYDYPYYYKIFGHIKGIMTVAGHIPSEVLDYRYSLYKKMLELIKASHAEDYDQIYNAL